MEDNACKQKKELKGMWVIIPVVKSDATSCWGRYYPRSNAMVGVPTVPLKGYRYSSRLVCSTVWSWGLSPSDYGEDGYLTNKWFNNYLTAWAPLIQLGDYRRYVGYHSSDHCNRHHAVSVKTK